MSISSDRTRIQRKKIESNYPMKKENIKWIHPVSMSKSAATAAAAAVALQSYRIANFP